MYTGYFKPDDLKAFKIIKEELEIVNPSLKIIKGDLVNGLIETKIQFELQSEHNIFLKRLINRGLNIKYIDNSN